MLVRGTGAPGSTHRLLALPYDRYIPQTRPAWWDQPCHLATLEYGVGAPVEPPKLPERLRVDPPLREADATAVRVMSLA